MCAFDLLVGFFLQLIRGPSENFRLVKYDTATKTEKPAMWTFGALCRVNNNQSQRVKALKCALPRCTPQPFI